MDVVFCKRWGGHTAATAINPGPAAPQKKKKKEKKRSTYKIPQVVYTIVMGYIFNGTYSAKGSFVKELNIYL